MTTKEIAIVEAHGLPDRQTLTERLRSVHDFQQLVRTSLIDGHDFGTIPGTQKPTLLKPGAEKIAKLLGLADTYEFMDKVEMWEKPFFSYTIRCSLLSMSTGEIVSQGIGNCNSYEDKYRWRDASPECPACGKETIRRSKAEWGGGWYCNQKAGGCGEKFKRGNVEIEGQQTGRVENPDPFTLVNTFMKMAKKRALVDASLSAGRLSDLFTQDLEEVLPSSQDTSNAPEAPANGPVRPAQPAKQAQQAPAKPKPGVLQVVEAAMEAYGKSQAQVLAVLGVEYLGQIAKTFKSLGEVQSRIAQTWGDPPPPDLPDDQAEHMEAMKDEVTV